MEVNAGFVIFAVILFAVIVVRPVWNLYRGWREQGLGRDAAAKAEAFFKASFPELQPHFHPQAVADYLVARRSRGEGRRKDWDKPPGFAAAAKVRFEGAARGERTVLVDAAGASLAEFVLEPKEGALGAIRVGPGKFTVRQSPGKPPRVSYWHPDREFEWRGPGQWTFRSRVSDRDVDTDRDSGSSSSSSSSSPATAAAAAAGIVGLGGTFDGGGASAGWDEGKGGGDSGDSGGASTTSY